MRDMAGTAAPRRSGAYSVEQYQCDWALGAPGRRWPTAHHTSFCTLKNIYIYLWRHLGGSIG